MIEKIGTVSTKSVKKGSGKDWQSWIDILDRAQASRLTHAEIAAILKKKYRLRPWWQHVVANGYEIYIGRKGLNRNEKGEWSLTSTKSFKLSATKLWKMICAESGLKIWLKPLSHVKLAPGEMFETEDGYFGELRTRKQNRHLRLTWQDPEWTRASSLTVFLVSRPKESAILVFTHTRIPDGRTQRALRERWQNALAELKSRFEKSEISADR